eukprot:scaffold100326_cov51-Phaeocystis_antarctica.AAC.4
MRGEVQTGRLEVAADRGARSVQERARLQIGGRACGGAYVEHVDHVCDAGGIEAQRLVERRRALPRVERRACDAGKVEDREFGGGGRPRRTQRAGEGSTADWEQDVSKLSGLLKFDAPCGAKGGRGGDHGPDRLERGVLEKRARRIQVEIRRFKTHSEHLAHVQLAHVGDARDVPADNGAVRFSGGSWVSVELLDRRLQGGFSLESGRAGPRTPARAVGEGRGARPCAPDEQLVGVGQGICALPIRKQGIRCGVRCKPNGGRAAGDGGPSSMQGAWGGAHVEHVAHVCDAGGVEAQRLVERRRVAEHVEHVCNAVGVEAQRLVKRRCTQEHAIDGHDAGGVKAQLLVE